MNNEHNPIYRKVEKLREFWADNTEKRPDYSLARWLMYPADVDLLIGLLKLESSPHGQLPEVFVVMITPFMDIKSFSYNLVNDWIVMFRIESEKAASDKYAWDYKFFEERLKNLGSPKIADDLLIEMLNSFNAFIDDKRRNLVLGLIPQSVSDFKAYNDWLHQILNKKQLNVGIKLMTLDHVGKNYLEEVCEKNPINSLTLEPGNLDTFGAMKSIATQGNPRDPQVQMRKCMFEMADAVSKNNKAKLYQWGEEILKVGQRSGQKSLYASVHLIYSGFLMQFQEIEKINELLLKGIRIAKSALPAQKECIPILIQLYGFQASNYALAKEFDKAVEWFINQADVCMEHSFPSMAISSYKNAVIIAKKNNLYEEYTRCAKTGYATGEKMKDEELLHSEYPLVAYHHYLLLKDNEEAEAENIKARMIRIYGPEWETSSEKMVQQLKSRKPIESV